MKKFTLCAAFFAFVSLTSKAQIEKGNVLIGGNVGFYSNTTQSEGNPKNTNSTFSISPSIAKAYKNNRLAGLSLTYRHYGSEDKSLNTNGYGIGAFLRQYKALGKSGFSVFAEESLNYNYNESKQLQGDFGGSYILKSQYQNINIGINPGFAYNLSKKIQLEFLLNNLVSLGYSHNRNSSSKDGSGSSTFISSQNNFSVNSDFNLSRLGDATIGIKILLGKK